MGPQTTRTAAASFPAVPASIAPARVWVCVQLSHHSPTQDWATVALLVGELATNAVVHAMTDDFTVRLDFADGIEAGVYDHDSITPRPCPKSFGVTSGQGLALVEAMADSWGAFRVDDGKWVWFRLGAHR